jgi:DNA-binding MltR family transcriptional regulator
MTQNNPMADEERIRQRYDEFFGSLSKESDRGCVLVAAAILDKYLEMLIRAEFSQDATVVKRVINPLFKGQGPLASFWSKTQLAYSLDLIPEWMYEDLERIRELRNEFAHRYKAADFEDPAVVRLTEKLKGANYAIRSLRASSNAPKHRQSAHTSPPTAPVVTKKERVRFIITVSWIAGWMHPGPELSQLKREILSLHGFKRLWDGR